MNKFNIGDQVFTLKHGFGKITGENPGFNHIYFKYSEEEPVITFNNDGKFLFSDFAPYLLTLEEAAKLGYFPKKKKVKKTIDKWVLLEPVSENALDIFNEPPSPLYHIYPNHIVVKTTLEWEVEE